jgi:hypothetical protein
MGVTVEAVRGRIKRGTLEHERDSGTVYVLLHADQPGGRARPVGVRPQYEPDVLTSELRDRLRYVEGQLSEERQAHAEARRLLMAALERIPPQAPLEAPRESPETAAEASEGAQPRPDSPGPQGGVQRPWWRRVLGR